MRLVATLLMVIFVSGDAFADEPGFRWPADGTWARYETKATLNIMGQKLPMSGTTTLASVGKERVNDEDCRWLEFVFDARFPEGKFKQKIIYKCLVAEKWLKNGETPTGHWIKAWTKTDDQPAEAYPSELLSTSIFPMNLTLAAPNKTAIKVEKKTMETKFGKLDCDGVAWDLSIKGGQKVTVTFGAAKTETQTQDIEMKIRQYFHEKAPFGLAAASISKDSSDEEMTLVEIGTGAKSQLPADQLKR